MGFPRLNNNFSLPAIRSPDGNHAMDTGNDFPSSPQRIAQRSMPLPIPLSKSSPTSSRGVSFASQSSHVPPVPSLNPPPILSLDPPSLPSHRYHHHDDDSMAEDCDDSEGKEIARRRRREETRDRDGRGNRLSSNDWPSRVSRKNGEPQYDPPSSLEDTRTRNENPFPKYWSSDFPRKPLKNTKELSTHIASINTSCSIYLIYALIYSDNNISHIPPLDSIPIVITCLSLRLSFRCLTA